MKKFLSFIAIILGIFTILVYYNEPFNSLIVSLMPVFEYFIPVFVLNSIGAALSILCLTKYKKDTNMIINIAGLILNFIPIISYIPTLILTS